MAELYLEPQRSTAQSSNTSFTWEPSVTIHYAGPQVADETVSKLSLSSQRLLELSEKNPPSPTWFHDDDNPFVNS